MPPKRSRTGLVLGLLAFICIVTGVAFIYWPAALIVAGILITIEQLT